MCDLPSYVGGSSCPYNENYYSSCIEDKLRACKESGYTNTSCSSGEVVNQTCPYNSSHISCKCNPCIDYNYTYPQATAQGYVSNGSCLSCNTTKYKRKENPCSGYTTCECGGAIGASVCYTGSVKKFNSCKACCDGTYKLTSCDSSKGICESCGGKYKYTSCKTGWILSANNCVANACSGYGATSCDTSIGTCNSTNTCLSGTTTKYKYTSCKTGWYLSGGDCKKKFLLRIFFKLLSKQSLLFKLLFRNQ